MKLHHSIIQSCLFALPQRLRSYPVIVAETRHFFHSRKRPPEDLSARSRRLHFCPVVAPRTRHFFPSRKQPPEDLSARSPAPPVLSGHRPASPTFLPLSKATTGRILPSLPATSVLSGHRPRPTFIAPLESNHRRFVHRFRRPRRPAGRHLHISRFFSELSFLRVHSRRRDVAPRSRMKVVRPA